MPRSKKNIKRSVIDTENIENAVTLVKAKKSTLHGASVHFCIPRTTLRQYYHHMMKEGTYVQDLSKNLAVKKVFNEEQNKMLVANFQFGLTLQEVKVLGYQFAKVNKINYPTTWDSKQMARDLYPHQDINNKINPAKRIKSKREVYHVPEMEKYCDFC